MSLRRKHKPHRSHEDLHHLSLSSFFKEGLHLNRRSSSARNSRTSLGFNDIESCVTMLTESEHLRAATNWIEIFRIFIQQNVASQKEEVKARVTSLWGICAREMQRKYNDIGNGYAYSLQKYLSPLLLAFNECLDRNADSPMNSYIDCTVYIMKDIIWQFQHLHWHKEVDANQDSGSVVLSLIIESYENGFEASKHALLALLESYVKQTKLFSCLAPQKLKARYGTLLHFAIKEKLDNLTRGTLEGASCQEYINVKDENGHTPLFYVSSVDNLSKILDLPCIVPAQILDDVEDLVLEALGRMEKEGKNWTGMKLCKLILCNQKLAMVNGKKSYLILQATLVAVIAFLKSGNKLADELKPLIENQLKSMLECSVIDKLDQDKLFTEIKNSSHYELFILFQKYNALSKVTSDIVNMSGDDDPHILISLFEKEEDRREEISALLKIHSIDINPKASHEKPVFILSLERGYEQVVTQFLEHPKFDIDACSGKFKCDIVHHLVIHKMSAELLQKVLTLDECGIDWRDEHENTPVVYALKNQQWDLIHILCLHKKVNINVADLPHQLVDEPQRTTLKEIEKIQPHKKISFQLKDSNGNTVLHTAATKGSVMLLQKLILHSFDIANFNALNKKNETPLHSALMRMRYLTENKFWKELADPSTKHNQKEVVLFILDQPDINVNLKDSKGNAAIHFILGIDYFDKDVGRILKTLIEKKDIDLNLANVHGDTPLHLMAHSSASEDTINAILPRALSTINDKNSKGDNPLQIAVRHKNFTFAKMLLELDEINPNIDIDNASLLFYSIVTENNTLLRLILNHARLKINSTNKAGDTVLHQIMKNKAPNDLTPTKSHDTKSVWKLRKLLSHEDVDIQIMQKLLSHEDIDIYQEDRYGYSPFLLAIMYEIPHAVYLFLEHKSCDVTYADSRGQPLVFYALEYLEQREIRPFLKHPTFNACITNYYDQNLRDIYEALPDEKKTPQLKSMIKEATQHLLRPPDLIKQKAEEIGDILKKYHKYPESDKKELQMRMTYFQEALKRIETGSAERSISGMHHRHQEVLIRNRVYLLEELEPANILHGLVNDEVLTQDEYEEIDVEKTRKAKVIALLDKLPRSGPKAFASFIKSLKENQCHVAEQLVGSDDSTL